jgi:glucose/arabinose dehydrogenase
MNDYSTLERRRWPGSATVPITNKGLLLLLGTLALAALVAVSLSTTAVASPTAALAADNAANLEVVLVELAAGFDQPVDIAQAGDERLFIVEQKGVIRIVDTGGNVWPEPFLDIQDRVGTAHYEQGLLGLAFHPDYAGNGYFYVHYTGGDDQVHVARFSVMDGDSDTADPDSEFTILTVTKPYQNNNGGDLNFGPDGYLYVALGDGGGSGDPGNLAQDGQSLLGKILRLDVNGTTAQANYLIPPDNPFVGDPAVRDEIWSLGLRNPWRFSFDRLTGDMVLADVGLHGYEEVNFEPAGSPGGLNFGWRCYEGPEPYNLDGCGPVDDYTFPVHAYSHWQGGDFVGCSITGGYVYRGHWSPALIGRYIFADYCSGRFWTLSAGDAGWQLTHLGQLLTNASTFGEDANGELYVAGHGDGRVYRLKAVPTVPSISLAVVAGGFSSPLGIVHSGLEGDDRLFIVQKGGHIRILNGDGTIRPTPFLNLTGQVSTGSEQGLLGLAFHPGYATNGYFYVNYTDTAGHTRIVRFSVNSDDPHTADPASALTLLTINQPASNHNGGNLTFGPDGYLYIGMGDGGSSGDPWNNGQTMTTLLGKMLRIDVDATAGLPPDCGSGSNYTIPADNPFVSDGTACNEIWAAGLRNPWRFSFDRLLGDLYIGDVGQNAWEEIDWQPAGSSGGENYGWRCYEGNAPYNLAGCGPAENYTFPIQVHSHGPGDRSITGGFVYRGSDYPVLHGHYVYADYLSGRFWALHPDGDGGWQLVPFGQLQTSFRASTFGEDGSGELYVAHLINGTIYRIQENSSPPTPTPMPTNTAMATGTATATATTTATATATPTGTATATATATTTVAATATPTSTATATATPTSTGTATATTTPAATVTATVTATPPAAEPLNRIYLPLVQAGGAAP